MLYFCFTQFLILRKLDFLRTGELMGYAWSGIPCLANSNFNCGYGWISFNKVDIETKLSDTIEENSTPHNGPKLSKDRDPYWELSGSVKFMSFEPSNSSFDGFVDLSGVSYNSSKNRLEGVSEKTYVVPQIYFCDPNNPDNPTYCITVDPQVYPNQQPKMALKKPIIKSVKAAPCESPTNCPLQIQWQNPMDYDEVKIKAFNVTNPEDKFNGCADESNKDCWHNKNVKKTRGDFSYTFDNLHSGTTYKFFIRGKIIRK